MERIDLELHCTDFPGLRFGDYYPVYLALQQGQDLVDATPGDRQQAIFHLSLEVGRRKDGSPSFRGPFVHGKPGEQYLYLVWYADRESGPERFRRAKLMLEPLTWKVIGQGRPLRAHICLTDKKGEPVCARLREEHVRWEW